MRTFRVLAAALAASTMAGAAFAADLPSRKSAPPVYMAPAPIFTWSGLYVGVNGGGWFNNSSVDIGLGSAKLGGGGFLVGGTAGYNWQMANRVVLGVETDLDYRSKANVTPSYGVATSSSDGYLGTARVRLGYGFDRALVYVTGGLAYGNPVSPNAYFAPALGYYGVRTASGGTSAGWTAGGGLEFAVTNNWSIKGEYLYADLGSKTVAYSALPLPVAVNDKTAEHTARVGLNYRFGFGGAPVMAKY